MRSTVSIASIPIIVRSVPPALTVGRRWRRNTVSTSPDAMRRRVSWRISTAPIVVGLARRVETAARVRRRYHRWYHTFVDKTTVYLPLELKTALRRAALQRGVSEAEVIRESIRQAVLGDARPRPKGGLYRGQGADRSARRTNTCAGSANGDRRHERPPRLLRQPRAGPRGRRRGAGGLHRAAGGLAVRRRGDRLPRRHTTWLGRRACRPVGAGRRRLGAAVLRCDGSGRRAPA